MKYAEFKNEVEKLGFRVSNRIHIDYIVDVGRINWVIASVDRYRVCVVDTGLNSRMIAEERFRQLFPILVEFAQTTIEARCYGDV